MNVLWAYKYYPYLLSYLKTVFYVKNDFKNIAASITTIIKNKRRRRIA
jgi:hypothetical protein